MLVALVSFVTGEGRLVKVGEFVADDDPVVTEREHLFGVAAPSPEATARTFVPQDWCVLHLPPPSRISSTTSLVVKTDMGGDGTYETTLSATDYLLEPTAEYVSGVQRPWRTVRSLNGARFPVLPYGKATVQITALWGWAAVPAAVKQATFIVAADLWKAKDAAFGVAGFGEFGAVRVGSRINPQAQVLLAPFVENARLA
jgi:hypothetical protein